VTPDLRSSAQTCPLICFILKAQLTGQQERSFPMLALRACSAYNECMQYTIRNIPDTLDEALRQAAHKQGKSLNEIAIEALARGAGITGERSRQRDLRDIAGTWRKDAAFESALAAQDTVDEEMWR
jgi:plasmid stability protein